MDDQTVTSVVFITDENYVLPTSVAMSSMISNKKLCSVYNVYILSDDISLKSQEILKSMELDNFNVNIVEMEKSKIEDMGQNRIPHGIHVSKAALFKFLIPELFKDESKILYLDSDVIVKSDLTELFELDVSDVYAAVVKDMKPMVSYEPQQTEKIGVKHTAYFNTGVMLLNLDLIRKEGITEKLIEYRKNGINYFMDQDTYNNVFDENVKYLDYTYNFTYSNYEYYSFEQLKKYYNFEETDEECLLNSIKILHLSNKEKPWLFYDVPFSEDWDFYFEMSPFRYKSLERSSVKKGNVQDEKTLTKELTSCKNELRSIKESFSYRVGRAITHIPRKLIGFYYDKKRRIISYRRGGLYDGAPRDKKIIVSMTSYPGRIKIVPYVLQSLFRQTVKPDKIILYLSKKQFLGERLPRALTKAERYGVDIIFKNDDLKPHKKYFYSMQEYPEELIVTVDDDVVYHPKMIERLYKSYILHPDCVSASRVHKMNFDHSGKILPYNSWHKNFDHVGVESMLLVATGVGGVLYPPHSIHPMAFNSEIIKKTSLMADDLWLKVMEVLRGTKVVLASKDATYDVIPKSQESALWITNVDEGSNDVQLNNILDYLGENKNFVVYSIRNNVSVEILKCDSHNSEFDVYSK